MRETRVLCRSIRTRSLAWYVNKRLRPCHDAAIFRAYETRAKSAPRSVCTALRGWRNCARDRSNEHIPMLRQSHTRHGFSSKIPVSAPEAARNDEIAGWIAMWCARARYTWTHIYTHTYSHSHVMNDSVPSRRTRFCATISLPGPSTPLSLASPLARHRF